RSYPVSAPASAPSPPRTAPSVSDRFLEWHIAAPQIAPETIRKVSGAAFTRLGVNGSLSTINSLMANSAILLDVPAETILAIGEGSIRIPPRLTAQAIAASAVIGRKPATTPIPI